MSKNGEVVGVSTEAHWENLPESAGGNGEYTDYGSEEQTTLAQGDEELAESILGFDSAAEIAPYRFEPVPSVRYESPDSESDTESEAQLDMEVEEDKEWCSCTKCHEMPSRTENKCCHSYQPIRDILEGSVHTCITDHKGFYGNCLNEYVLEASVYEFVADTGLLGDDEPVNELMRYLAYRRFIRWVFGKLGKKNRRVIPACAVRCIREKFHSEFYHGFRYPIY